MKRLTRWALALAGAVAFAGTGLAESGAAAGNELQSINVARQAGTVVVKLGLKQPLPTVPASFGIASPARIVIDLPATTNRLGRNLQTFNEAGLRSANFVQTPEKMRLVLNLSQSMTHAMRIDGDALLITLEPFAVDAAASQAASFAPERLATAHAVRDIAFRRGADGEARIAVELSDVGAGIDIRQSGSTLIVDFSRTKLPDHLKRRVDVTDFGTPVTNWSAMQQGETARLSISPKGLWEHSAYQTDTRFVIEVKPIVENPNKLVQGSRGGYQGEKLSLNFQNVDVRPLLQVIGEFTGMNVVVSDTVSGSLTLILKDVPWDQALDIILQQRGLDMRKNGNVILIAPRDEIAAKEKLEFESRQQIGDLEPLRSESFQLNYHKAKAVFDFLKNKDQTILSKRGSVMVDERTNKLFAHDTPGRLDDLRRLVTEIDIPMRQVMIEARIVEAADSFSKDLGVRLGLGGVRLGVGGGNVSGSIVGGGTLDNSADGIPKITNAYNVNLPAVPRSGSAGSLAFTLFNSAQTQFLGLEISALEADGRGKVVSSPRVVTADQVEAIIEQGVEIPYQQATASGATSVSFKKANLSLKVKPHITPDGKITLSVDVNKDTPNTRVQTGVIAIDTKHVKTEVLVENGGTVVIGGIYQQESRESVSRIPLLGEIPYLGWLFRNRQTIDDKSELLVFITPRIVSEAMAVR